MALPSKIPNLIYPKILLSLLLLTGCFGQQAPENLIIADVKQISENKLQKIDCNILIVGGGIGGLHTAYQLGKQRSQSICLFELENRLGGRIFDITLDGNETSPRIGVGARRIFNTHSLYSLAQELGIRLHGASNQGDLIVSRGQYAESQDKLAILAYPKLAPLDKSNQNETEVEDALYKQLKMSARQQLPDFPTYVKASVSPEGYHYLLDVSRFRGDFQYPIDTKSYLDWLKEESTSDSGKLLYPEGGMSEFVQKMSLAARKQGVKFYTSQPVQLLRRTKPGYEAITPGYRISANKVVLAVNAVKLKAIQGDVVGTIVNSSQYLNLLNIPVVTITQWWPQPWWKKAYLGKDISRVWSTDHCINLMEIPTDQYGSRQLVSRTVYSDEMSCVALWQQLNQISMQAVEAEIMRELNEIFPDIDIPKPVKTYVQIWPDAWYWLKAGSPFTNCDIADWAINPLPGEPVYLVGESYNPQRATWSEGAIRSSNAALNAGFGFHFPHSATSSSCEFSTPINSSIRGLD